MTVTRIQEIDELIRGIDEHTLRQMVLWTAHSHALVCRLTSQEGGCAHLNTDETRSRLEAMSVPEMASILAPFAWLALDLDRLVGDQIDPDPAGSL